MQKKFRFLDNLKWLDPFTYVDIYVMPKVNPKKSKSISAIVSLISAFVFAYAIYAGLGFLLQTPSPMVIVVSGSMEPFMHRGDVVLLQGVKAEALKAEQVDFQRSIYGLPLDDYAEAFCKGQFGEKPCREYVQLMHSATLQRKDFNLSKIKFSNGQVVENKQTGDTVVYQSQLLNEPIIHRTVAKLKANDGFYLLTKGDSVENPLLDQDPAISISPYPVPMNAVQGRYVFHLPFLGYVKLLLFDDLPCFLFGSQKGRRCVFP